MSSAKITLQHGRSKPVLNQHPWIFSGGIQQVENAQPGDIVTVFDDRGQFLARGYWNPRSQIQVRLLSWQDETINDEWWYSKLKRAVDQRQPFEAGGACRLINAENDYLPGLIVDRYDNYLVLQALTLYIDQNKVRLAAILIDIMAEHSIQIAGVYERSDVDVRGKEGLKPQTGLISGDKPPANVEVMLDGYQRLVDIFKGHKTGYYLDQIGNHRLAWQIAERFESARVLNTFSYTGAFGLGSGGQVVNVDSSGDSLELARRTYEKAGRLRENVTFVEADVFQYLRGLDATDQYELIVLDPPKFAHNKQQVDTAARGYKDLNLHAFKAIAAGGYLMTFSCSGAISADLFQKIVFGALADTGRQAQIVMHLGPNEDHPVALTFPEGAYLKGLLVRVW